MNDSVTDPAFVIEAEEKENPEPSGGASGGGSGGCSLGFAPLGMLLLAFASGAAEEVGIKDPPA